MPNTGRPWPWFTPAQQAGVVHQLRQGKDLGAAKLVGLVHGVNVLQAMHHSLRHVAHPHGLKAGVGAGHRNQWEHRLQLGKDVHEFVLCAKNHARAQHGQVQPRAV